MKVFAGKTAGVFALLTFVSACASGPVPADLINDPHEVTNRQIHELNKTVDETVLAPAATAYGTIVPEHVRDAIDNSANNLELPGQVINHILQGQLGNALQTTGRFVINSTVGLAGLFDPASDFKLFEVPTDFGETLEAYGFAEGPYMELPLLGGSTVRGTIGLAVDFVFDPIGGFIPTPEREYLFLLKGVDIIGDRLTY